MNPPTKPKLDGFEFLEYLAAGRSARCGRPET
jgi:hypothetical protein